MPVRAFTRYIIMNNQMVFRFYRSLQIEAWPDAVPRFHKTAFRIGSANVVLPATCHLFQCFSQLGFAAFQIIQHTDDVFFCQCTRPGFGGICFIQFFHVPADFFFHIQKNLLGIAADITFIVSIYRTEF